MKRSFVIVMAVAVLGLVSYAGVRGGPAPAPVPAPAPSTGANPKGISDDPTYSPSNPLCVFDADRAALKTLSMVAEIQTPKSGGRWSRVPMYFDFVAPNKYHFELKGGLEGSLIIVADGTNISSYPTKTNAVTQTNQAASVAKIKSSGPADLTDLLTILATPSLTFSSLFNLVSSSTKDNTTLVTVTPKVAMSTYDKIMLVFSADAKTPVSAEASKDGKIIARVMFTTYSRNVPVAPERVVFTPPHK